MLVLACLATFVLGAVPALAVKGLSLKVIGPDSITDVDSFVIKTILTNRGDEQLTLLNEPNSILTPDWKTNVIGIVAANGSPAKFDGVRVKWTPTIGVANKNFTILNPGQTIELAQDLGGIYNLTASGSGAYTIDAYPYFKYLTEAGGFESIIATSESHIAYISGKLGSTKAAERKSAALKRPHNTYVGCSKSEQRSIEVAVPATDKYVKDALSYISKITSGSPRYTAWFGKYKASRAKSVKSHFSLMSKKASQATFDCDCTDDYYAYVFPDEPFYIHLCKAFWTAPTTGTDSKAGTIVHELSHFLVNGGTDDYAYGQTEAMSLAKSNPGHAVFNADSHEYFAENTPRLS